VSKRRFYDERKRHQATTDRYGNVCPSKARTNAAAAAPRVAAAAAAGRSTVAGLCRRNVAVRARKLAHDNNKRYVEPNLCKFRNEREAISAECMQKIMSVAPEGSKAAASHSGNSPNRAALFWPAAALKSNQLAIFRAIWQPGGRGAGYKMRLGRG